MVAVLKPNRSLKDTFYYNENKLKSGEAVCLLAGNYPREATALTEVDKLAMLQKMAALRPGVAVNSLHISLNFDPSESLSEEKMKVIAREYMQEIGFGNQPYLVYQHFDAAHPHIHLVTTNIQVDGKPISLHHLGIRASEPARKMIEQKYGLVKAESQGKTDYQLKPVALEKAVYGRSQTKRAIGNVLGGVLESYKFSSLAELNAVLGLYNVRAERGTEASRIYKHRGLVYRLLDIKGAVAGVPIKASSFPQKPGLDFLERRFLTNAPLKKAYQGRVKNAVDLALLTRPDHTLEELRSALQKQGIDLVVRENTDGLIYGITYVDHQTKCVFNGSELGKNYSVKAVQERLGPSLVNGSKVAETVGISRPPDRHKSGIADSRPAQISLPVIPFNTGTEAGSPGLAELLIGPEDAFEPNPFDLTRRRKIRKKKTNLKPL
jgi:hypothetical protein